MPHHLAHTCSNLFFAPRSINANVLVRDILATPRYRAATRQKLRHGIISLRSTRAARIGALRAALAVTMRLACRLPRAITTRCY